MTDFVSFGSEFTSQSCTPSSFSSPEIFGTNITNLEANLVTNYSLSIAQGWYVSHQALNVSNLVFCNVSLEYTHPGYGDNINTQVWLPVTNWNGRLQGSGGVGFATGLIPSGLAGAVHDGYAVVSTDGGHAVNPGAVDWYLSSPGNVNWMLLQNYADTSFKEAGLIGKSITKDFYGRGPTKSYWNGCSSGGRQGLTLAQRYPTLFDGILAAAPGIHLPKFGVAEHWPQILMQQAGEYPSPCEFEAITSAAIDACDELDGVKDRIISAPEQCTFDPKPLIGKTINCAITSGSTRISATAVQVAESIWTGARKPDGSFLWYGVNHDAPLTGPTMMANTVCATNATTKTTTCKLPGTGVSNYWLKYLIFRSPAADLSHLTQADLTSLFHESDRRYSSIISADDPDLTAFAARGGKMITWHGLADEILMPNQSRHYYESVAELDPNVADYYRYFEAPGVAHCMGGVGPYPGDALERLVEWVETGRAPDELLGTSVLDKEGRVYERGICAWPRRQVYKGGDVRKKESFGCV